MSAGETLTEMQQVGLTGRLRKLRHQAPRPPEAALGKLGVQGAEAFVRESSLLLRLRQQGAWG